MTGNRKAGQRHVCPQPEDLAGLGLPPYGQSLADQCIDHSKPERCICLNLATGAATQALDRIARRYRIHPAELAQAVLR